MATPTHQRVFILVLAVVMAVGTIGSFAALILANENSVIDAERAQKAQERLIEEQRKRNQPLVGYEAKPFDADAVDELVVDVLKEGKGEVVKEDSTILANYFGWQADGTIFDSTKKVDSDAQPIEVNLGGMIEGWTKGLSGQKVGSTVRLTIPAEQAYGNESIPGSPSGPLKFIVEIKELK